MAVKLAWVNTAQNTGPFIGASPDIPDAALVEIKKLYPGTNAQTARQSIRDMLLSLRAKVEENNVAVGRAGVQAAAQTQESADRAATATAWPTDAV